MQAPLIDIAYANTVATSAQWVAGTTAQKNAWIQQASIWLVANYSCDDADLITPIDDIKYAVALVCDLLAQGLVYTITGVSPSASIASKKTGMAGISCEVSYLGSSSVDPLRYVRDVLTDVCCQRVNTAGVSFVVRR